DYHQKDAAASYFRTSDGAEVDLIIEFPDSVWAVEIKSLSEVRTSDIRGLISFTEDHKVDRALCVCATPRPYKNSGVEFMNWKDFFRILAAI
ncbi:MAG: hypothetical protein AABZ57_01970, partial [Candidatus Margulisiibacteriota bacterium]